MWISPLLHTNCVALAKLFRNLLVGEERSKQCALLLGSDDGLKGRETDREVLSIQVKVSEGLD